MSTIVDKILSQCETIKSQASSLANKLIKVEVFDVKDDDLLDFLISKINLYKKFTSDSITEVIIPDNDYNIKEIPIYSFKDCSQLSSVTLSNNITTIKDNAFENCKSLQSIIIPVSVKTIGNLAFFGCTNLVLYFKTNLNYELTSIDTSYFETNNITVKYIDPILYSKTSDTTAAVTGYSSGGLSGNVEIRLIVSNLQVNTINTSAFEKATQMTSITIPNSIKSIGARAFKGCIKLTGIVNSEGVTQIIIPASVTNIGDSAFEGCTSLSSIYLPISVKTIGTDVFKGCTNLNSITIPNKVTTLGDGVFENCTSLTSVTIPTSVTSIGDNAFKGCSNLNSITIPNKVTTLGDGVFENCTSLTSVTIPTSVKTIGSNAFKGCTNLVLYFKTNLNYELTSIDTSYFETDNITVAYIDPILYSKTSDTTAAVIGYSSGGLSDTVEIKSTVSNLQVNSINSSAFESASMTNITIPDSVRSIGARAFKGCIKLTGIINSAGVTQIIIPASVTNIDDSAFEGCTSLSSIYLPASIYTIGSNVFKDCTNLTDIRVNWSADQVSGAPWGANGSKVEIHYALKYNGYSTNGGFTIGSKTNTKIISSEKNVKGSTMGMPSAGSTAYFLKTQYDDMEEPYEVTITKYFGSSDIETELDVSLADGEYIINNNYNYFYWPEGYSAAAYGQTKLSWGYNLRVVDTYVLGKFASRTKTKEPAKNALLYRR